MAADHDTNHPHGEMDVREQQRTYDGFVRFMIWGTVISIVILVFLALANS